MKNISITSKIFAFLTLTASAIWIGSYITRLFEVYQLFEGAELTLRQYITNENISGILFSLRPIILTPFISFIIMIIAFILFIIISKVNLKQNGWLFIILIAVLITLPFEAYLMTIDYKIISILQNSTFDPNQVLILLKNRITIFSGFPLIIILTYISFYYFIVFKPLTKIIEDK